MSTGTIRSDVVPIWECSDCGFEMHAQHTQADGTYSCPACAELRLAEEVEALKRRDNDRRRAWEAKLADTSADLAQAGADLSRALDRLREIAALARLPMVGP